MKILKVLLGILAGLGMLIQLPHVIDMLSPTDTSGYPLSYKLGGLTGLVVLGAFCVVLIGDVNKS